MGWKWTRTNNDARTLGRKGGEVEGYQKWISTNQDYNPSSKSVRRRGGGMISPGVVSTVVLWSLYLILSTLPSDVSGHGRLIEPPSRSSMWRYGFNTTANYNDHELYCGGFARQHQKNGGKCGVCGDPYDGPKPNEAGGPYALGIVVRKYRKNSIIRVKVELTANHKGYFEFRLCPNNNPKRVVSQKCLDNYILPQSNGEGPRYYPGEGTKVFESRYLLPKGMTCTQCVLQWRYIAANSWGGPCPDGSPEGLGCGPQEEFRACSDVAIYDDKGYASADEPIEEDTNDVGIDKLERPGSNKTSGHGEDDEDNNVFLVDSTTSPAMWPFVVALVLLIILTLGFASFVWWFYKKEIVDWLRESRNKLDLMRNNNNQNGSSSGGGMYSPSSMGVGVPVRPPRAKKPQHHHHHHHLHYQPDLYSTQRSNVINNNNSVKRGSTPDVISQPMQVTINGLPI